MCSGKGDWALPQPGFPIRTSPDHSSVGSSPRLIAASYVLHRLLVPRHPPCALSNLPQKSLLNNSCELLRMLASTMQFSTFGRVLPWCTAYSISSGSVSGRPNRKTGREETFPFPQDPTVCLVNPLTAAPFHSGEPVVLGSRAPGPPMSMFHP